MERQRKLLIILINANDYLSSAELAKALSVSTKTIFNDLDKLSFFLKKFNLRIKRKTGNGLKLIGKEENLQSLKDEFIDKNDIKKTQSLTSRQADICLYIFSHNTYIKDIAIHFFVSRSTVVRDIKQINVQLLSKYKVKIKNSYENLVIEGSEVDKRKALSKLILLKFDSSLEEKLLKNEVPLYINQLFNINLEPLLIFINNLENDYNIKFTIEAKSNLLIHLAIAVKRIRLNHVIGSTQKLQEQLISYQKYLPVLKKNIKDIEKEYQIEFDNDELYLMLIYIFSSKMINHNINGNLLCITKKFISQISKATQFDYGKDEELLDYLNQHLEVAKLRIKFGLEIYNPFLNYILEHNLYLFMAIQDNISIIFGKSDVPDSEIAFIAIHFMASKERIKKKKRILIVCDSGIGISSLLEQRIKKISSQYNVIGTASISEINEYPNVDLIISTVDLKNVTDKPFIVIKPFERINSINSLIVRQRKIRSKNIKIDFSSKRCWLLKNISNKEQALKKVSEMLSSNDLVSSDYLNALEKRESIGSTYIGNEVALIHGIYNNKNLIPTLNIFKLNQKIKWTPEQKVSLLINFIATDESKETFKMIFQRIGASIDDTKFWENVESLSLKKIPDCLNERFDLRDD